MIIINCINYMENEYNLLEKKILEGNLSETDKIKILEKQKELLLQFLIESNKSLFNSIMLRKEEINFEDFLITRNIINTKI